MWNAAWLGAGCGLGECLDSFLFLRATTRTGKYFLPNPSHSLTSNMCSSLTSTYFLSLFLQSIGSLNLSLDFFSIDFLTSVAYYTVEEETQIMKPEHEVVGIIYTYI